MAVSRYTIAAIALSGVLVVRPALSQAGASVSLTHTVSVTVPPRVKVQLASPQAQSTVSVSPTRGAVAISVSATQSWALSITSRGEAPVFWSTDENAAFSRIASRPATVATGERSQVPAATTLFLRNAGTDAKVSGSDGEVGAVVLTMVAP